jgi:GDPmannose 4,6-dehydratase
LFACNGILFNHESPRRGETFVSKKITKGIARILNGKEEKIYLGNLDAKRDWGFAPEYVEMMWKIMQKDNPEDYVIGTGIAGTVKDFLKRAFDYAGLDWQKHTAEDKKYFRPTETPDLIADCSKAKKELNWEPKIILEDLVKIMVDADMRQEGIIPIGEGDNLLREKFPDKWWKGD